jgi:hypothetical protein
MTVFLRLLDAEDILTTFLDFVDLVLCQLYGTAADSIPKIMSPPGGGAPHSLRTSVLDKEVESFVA